MILIFENVNDFYKNYIEKISKFKIIFYNIFLVMEIITNKFYISNYYNIIIKLLIYYQIIIIKLHMISIAKNPFIIL